MLRSGVRSAALATLLAASVCALGCDGVVEPTCREPTVVGSSVAPNVTNVLSALVTAEVSLTDSVSVRFNHTAAKLDSVTPAAPVVGPTVVLPVLGLDPAQTYDMQVVAFNGCATSAGAVLSFATDTLPADLPKYSASGEDPSPGYVVFGAGNYGLVIDNTGRVVWYRQFPHGPGLNFQVQPNGRYAARPLPATPADEARWLEIDPLGVITRILGCARGLQPRLHDLRAEPDGSYWILCDEIRIVDLSEAGSSAQSAVLGTTIQHLGPTGEILFDWSAFDHFDVDLQVLDQIDRSAAVINWTHGNALDLDTDGNLIVSFRNLNEVTKIDTRTGNIIWRMGGTHNQFAFENGIAPEFVHQHGVRAWGAGKLVLLDNLGDTHASHAERYEYDEARHTARLTASYAPPTGVVAQIGGSTQSLPDGHTLVAFGNGGSVQEYDVTGKVVWRIEGKPGYVFRAQRIRSLYKPGVGDPR